MNVPPITHRRIAATPAGLPGEDRHSAGPKSGLRVADFPLAAIREE